MTSTEGKAFLKNCLEQCNWEANIDIVHYKYGTNKTAEEYNNDEIRTDVDFKKVKSEVKYIVKCFIYMEIYIAWPVEIGRGNGKFIAYKKDLLSMETDRECTYKKVKIGNKGEAYYFRGEAGVKRFIQENLLVEKQ